MHKAQIKHKLQINKNINVCILGFQRSVLYLCSVSLGFVFFSKTVLALVLPGGGGGSNLPSGQPITLDVLDYIIFRVSTFFISISAVLAVIFIIWAGVTYMYAGDDSTKITAAQGRLKSGIIGAAIILGVGVIIQTIASVVTLDFFCTVRIPIVGVCVY
ncbi:MAG: hypothetical protein A3J47_04260 [Candidatus Yanofskybacteria bacterium RIFCSPHIGHO2_02_FULL_43_22]|uniref:Uncharacterized protein n=1 Tax=Candidatus Yanofskybacteria bacterium RIFCSPHIGHO2_02_FULL_43_22 TaxID=1802681 RepID=A0A1F8FN78_9BACT|nr:MAG: hypothetical protein A3J47_04260 [Candidatus Yanofskybacteria bacterium RIFCSPHIGHO2_02_FULL_43_22]